MDLFQMLAQKLAPLVLQLESQYSYKLNIDVPHRLKDLGHFYKPNVRLAHSEENTHWR